MTSFTQKYATQTTITQNAYITHHPIHRWQQQQQQQQQKYTNTINTIIAKWDKRIDKTKLAIHHIQQQHRLATQTTLFTQNKYKYIYIHT